MRRIFDHLRRDLYNRFGIVDSKAGSATIDELFRSEWSPDFEKFMRNRLVMGALRYGRMGDPFKTQYDRIGSIRDRLNAYLVTGNDELLVDIANLALLEYVEGTHPAKHFGSVDDVAHVKEQ